MELTRYSMIRDLRSACRYLGVSQAGSKEKLFNRIVETNKIASRRQALEVAQRQYEGEMVQAEVVQPAMRLPTAHERKLHEATHLPYRQWYTSTRRMTREQNLRYKWTLDMQNVEKF